MGLAIVDVHHRVLVVARLVHFECAQWDARRLVSYVLNQVAMILNLALNLLKLCIYLEFVSHILFVDSN